jgi:HNH endonuclease/NUMOD4 motif
MSERWLPVIGYEGTYEVSDGGGVRRIARGRGSRPGQNRKLVNRDGYPEVTLSINNKAALYKVHRLVAAAFIGAPPEGHEVNHINGIKHDNRSANLEWVTRRENTAHAYRIGIREPAPSYGSANGFAVLTEDSVRQIRSRRTVGDSLKILSRDFGTTMTTISRICLRKAWRHI